MNHFSRETLFETARHLPPAPRVLAHLGELLQQPNTDLDTVTELIKVDPSLSIRIIRMSNSIVYGGHSIGDIDEAVHRVGFKEVHRLVGIVATERLSDRDLTFYGIDPQRMREHMLYTAIAAEAMADTCNIEPHIAYTTGLLRTLGMLVLDRAAQHLSSCEAYDHAKHGSYTTWEGIWFGLPNSEVGGLILTDWRFPKEIIWAIKEHYLVKTADYNNRLACLLNIACSIVTEAGFGLPGDQKYWPCTERKLDVLGVTEDARYMASQHAMIRFGQVRGSIL